MLAANNLLKPSDGKPVAVPTQDMVIGSYYLTMIKEGEAGQPKYFADAERTQELTFDEVKEKVAGAYDDAAILMNDVDAALEADYSIL
jgi:DNA-directed RNA polymerase subunit beta'